MKRFILLAVIGVFLTKNVTPSKIDKYPSNLGWLFGLNNNLNKSDEQTRTVCRTQECEKIAKVIKESMDESVNPCDDFYEYACGKWPEHNPIPEGNKAWSLFYMVQATVFKQMKGILDAGPSSNDLLGVKLAKKWYSVCMDTDAMEKQGLDPLVFTLARIGGWPIIMDPDEWNEQEYSWQKVDNQYMRLMGRNAFHDVRVSRLSLNETAEVEIDTPHLPPGAYQLWAETLDSYDSDEIEDEGDEDPSDEEKQSDEGSQEPGSEGEDDDDDDNSDNDNDNGDNNDSNNEENETDEQDKDAKKKISKKKSTNKIIRKKNRKLDHNEKKKSDNRVTKKRKSHKMKTHRIKRGILPRKADSKSLQHFTHRGKLHVRRNKKVRAGKKRIERITLNDKEMMSTTPQDSTEETSDETESKTKQKYADYISNVARALAKARGTDVPEEHIDKDIEDMIEFQIKLTEIVVDSGDELEMTLDEFQDWYDENESNENNKINWVYKIAELFDEATVPVDGDLDVKISATNYFEALASLLDETSSRTIVNYIHWNFLSQIIKTTTNEMRNLYKKWKNAEESEENKEKKKDDIKSRAFTCVMEVEMSDIVAYEYVSKYFSDDITRTANDMVDDIQKEVEYLIKESDWMDEDTKDFALAKLVNMKKFIGYPDWYKNSTIVKQYFQGLIICNSYYENVLSYKRYIKWKSLRKLTRDEDVETWWMNPMTVNAFFDFQANSISISAADFQSPLFGYSRPQAINYGIIGFVMAHEVNHGFDNTGHLYDKNGDFVEWLSVMAQAYGKRAACFVEQFNNYPVDKKSNVKLKNYGNQTIGDNIADTMGLQAIYKAYQRRERECGKPDTVLPGLEEVTHDQLFFLSFANLWCENVADSEINMERAKMDSHSTGPLRVIGSISNSEDFAKAYNCPVGSAMNPEKKCNIWK